jgi:hypothetical protein
MRRVFENAFCRLASRIGRSCRREEALVSSYARSDLWETSACPRLPHGREGYSPLWLRLRTRRENDKPKVDSRAVRGWSTLGLVKR